MSASREKSRRKEQPDNAGSKKKGMIFISAPPNSGVSIPQTRPKRNRKIRFPPVLRPPCYKKYRGVRRASDLPEGASNFIG